jgi:hypothetical protein
MRRPSLCLLVTFILGVEAGPVWGQAASSAKGYRTGQGAAIDYVLPPVNQRREQLKLAPLTENAKLRAYAESTVAALVKGGPNAVNARLGNRPDVKAALKKLGYEAEAAEEVTGVGSLGPIFGAVSGARARRALSNEMTGVFGEYTDIGAARGADAMDRQYYCVVVARTVSSTPETARRKPSNSTAITGNIAAETPEDALRSFLIAIALHDEAALRSVVLPTDDFDWLLKGEAAPAEAADQIRSQFMQVPIRALKPGDSFRLPNKKSITVDPKEVDATHAVLLPEGAPLPTRCQKVDGRWRVDASPVIAGRKAAEAARAKAKRRR